MKFVAVIIICVIIIGAVIIAMKSTPNQQEQYLRIHIRANSNDASDQSVKYKVKESVVEYMTPKLENVSTKKQAMNVLKNNLDNMKKVADRTLALNGYAYTSNIRLCQEEFPVRTYGDLTLESGVYDALIIELGSGTGDNWWCVVFPPLCFVGDDDGKDEDFEYKSFFEEMYDKYVRK